MNTQHSKSWIHSIILGNNPNNDRVELEVDDSHHLKTIDESSNKRPYTGKMLLGSANSLLSYADTLPIPSSDPDNRLGWLHHKNVANTDKLNYYFYSEGNIALKLNEITNIKAVVSIDNYTSSLSIPFFVVYTKMTGVGDAGVWYHSKRNYGIDAGKRIIVGEEIQMYSINKKSDIKGHRQVPFNITSDTGDCDGEEEILSIAIHTDSTSPVDTKILVKSLGYETSHGIEINLELASI